MKNLFLLIFIFFTFSCTQEQENNFDSVILEIINFDFSSKNSTYNNDVNMLIEKALRAKPNSAVLSGTDMNNLCDLLNAAKSLPAEEFDKVSSNINELEQLLKAKANEEKFAYTIYQRCRDVLSLESKGKVKRY